VIFVLLMVLGADTIALKDKASVSGRWIRVIDLLDDRTDAAARIKIADIYLGRAPEEGKSRTITVEEIRRELERRGIDPAAYTWKGDRVEVTLGAAGSEALRTALALEIKRQQKDAASVRILQIRPEADGDVVEVKPKGAGWVAALSTGVKIDVVARIVRTVDAVYAVRDLPPGRAIDRADLELKRVEMADDEKPADMASLIGGIPAVRIRQGSAVTFADLRLKAVVKKGDVVRAVSSGYEVDARALEDGGAGQEIGLEFMTSRNRVRGRVANHERVDVVEASR
jgi:flagella basal body P-ring formation protein FlgA